MPFSSPAAEVPSLTHTRWSAGKVAIEVEVDATIVFYILAVYSILH
jgi:hypothetical protein